MANLLRQNPANLSEMIISENLPKIPEAEMERRKLAAQRFKERCSSDPFYADMTDEDWLNLHGSMVNSNG